MPMSAQIRRLAALLVTVISAFAVGHAQATEQVLVEAESFLDKGGWVLDPQFVEQMGSPYLMAHGMGTPVANAVTTLKMPAIGTYHVWARTKDWVPGKWDPPGQFKILVDGKALPKTLGVTPGWGWGMQATLRSKATRQVWNWLISRVSTVVAMPSF